MWKTSATAFCLVLFITAFGSVSAEAQTPDWISGITIENAEDYTQEFNLATCENLHPQGKNDLNKLLERIDNLGARGVTVRVVFQDKTNPSSYRCILKEFKKHNYRVMGLIFDSKALAKYHYVKATDAPADCSSYDDKKHDYKARVNCYVESLDPYVDIWEAGNEVNGEWAEEKDCIKHNDAKCVSVVEKVRYAVDKTAATGKPVALTLIHQPDCTKREGHEMFDWFGKIEPLLPKVNYLLVSYYEDNCDNGNYYECDGIDLGAPPFNPPVSYSQVKYNYCSSARPGRSDDPELLRKLYWNIVFYELHRRSSAANPDIKIGFGEVGCKKKHCDSRTDLLNRYYSIRPLVPTNPGMIQPWFTGGYFWWTAQPDILTDGGFYPAIQSLFRHR